MNPLPASESLNSCGCCEGGVSAPQSLYNRPGLSAIAYRIGTHARFKQRMLARLSASDLPALQGLLTRNDDDLSIALLDGWATVADVLTFYQERIANESYLRTAHERLSLVELTRLIGYRPSPGVAASVYLAFTLDSSPGSPTRVPLESGTQAQSVPGPGQAPQTFETIEAIEARPAWNAIKPRSILIQPLTTAISEFWLAGVSANLAPGDVLLTASATDASSTANAASAFYRVTAVNPDSANQRTRVAVSVEYPTNPAAGDGGDAAALTLPGPTLDPQLLTKFYTMPIAISDPFAWMLLENRIWRGSDLEALAAAQGWSVRDIFASIARQRGSDPDNVSGALSLFAFRVRASLFGYNAPNWGLLPSTAQKAYGGSNTASEWPFPTKGHSQPPQNQLDLSAVFNRIPAGSWVAVQGLTAETAEPPATIIATVASVTEVGLADFTISGKATRLQLTPLDATAHAEPHVMSDIRNTVVYAQSEQLLRAGAPIATPLGGSALDLDGLYDGLRAGQAIAVSGERTDVPGVSASEVRIVGDVIHDTRPGGVTWLTLTNGLAYHYRRETVTINANLALATHGQTQEEALGSGDGSQPYQRFTLRQSPLTYTATDSGDGAESSLHVRVNDLLWHEVPTFYGKGPRDRVFVTQTQDDGATIVEFGDGQSGARLATGQNNVVATYRRGTGVAGQVKAGRLSLLMSHPLGVNSVTNPLDATGAADPQTLESARLRAPLAVLTLGRIVSLPDYQDFAQAFAGVGKALATWTWDGQTQGVFVTVAGSGGADIPDDSPLYGDLVAAIQKASEPYVDLRVRSYRKAFFRLSAAVLVDPDQRQDRVLEAVAQALRAAFSFDARAFGQPVTLSEVISVIQMATGVVAVTVSQLYRSDTAPGRSDTLTAAAPQPGALMSVDPAELLTLDPAPLTTIGVMS